MEASHVTQGLTDYMYYETEIDIPNNSKLSFWSYKSVGYIVYVDGVQIADVDNHEHNEGDVSHSVTLKCSGKHNISLLYELFGYADGIYPGHEPIYTGISKIQLNNEDISNRKWLHKAYLYGEVKKYYNTEGSKTVAWEPYVQNNEKETKWYKTTFDLPNVPSDAEVVFDVEGLSRGHAFINGRDLGRYWNVKYNSEIYSQRYYLIPKDWLKTV